MNHSRTLLALASVALCVAACSKQSNSVRITNVKAAKTTAPVAQPSRSEPVFYNGKNYHMEFSAVGEGLYLMSVKGMSAKQQKDAVAVATSSLRYFACPDGKTGKVAEAPRFADGKWSMTARCA